MVLRQFGNLEFLRVNNIVGPNGVLPIGKSTWWAGVESGKFPKPIDTEVFGKNVTVWAKSDIVDLINKVAAGGKR